MKSVFLELTKACNQNCIFCSNIFPKIKENLEIGGVKKLIDELLEINVEDIRFYGGEPFLYPHLFEVMEYINGYGIEMNIYTNGTILNEDIISNIKKYKVKKVLISLDGSSADIHDKIRGVEGNFEKTIANIKELMKNNINVVISITVCRMNKENIENLYELLYSMGVNNIRANFVSKVGRAKEKWDELSLDLEEMRLCIESINRVHMQLFGCLPVRKPCQAGIDEIYIAANGDVFPCVLLHEKEEYRAGNIRISRIKDIIEKPDGLFGNIRKTIKEIKYCPQCKNKDVCGGGCRARAIAESGCDLCGPDTVSCIFHGVI